MSARWVLEQGLLILAGIGAGGIISAGVFAFLAIIGIFPRLIGHTHTHRHILLYETFIILGGVCGNILDIYEFPVLVGGEIGLGIFGLATGVFVGCLAMSLAEMLKAVPVIARRLHISVGIQYLILAVAAGKCLGSLIYFYRDMGA